MKKIKNLVILILFLFLSITIVQAENDIFKYAWEKELININTIENSPYELIGNQKKGYKEGYIITTVKANMDNIEDIVTTLNYYNNKGELLRSKDFEGMMISSLNVKDDYVYVLLYDILSLEEENDIYTIIALNDNLDEIGKDTFVETTSGHNLEGMLVELGILSKIGIDFISTENNEVTFAYTSSDEMYLIHYDKDLKNKNQELLIKKSDIPEDITEDEYKELMLDKLSKIIKYYPILSSYLDSYEEYINTGNEPENIYLLFDQKDTEKIYSGANISKCENITGPVPGKEELSCHLSSVIKLTNNNQIVFEKNYDDYAFLFNAKIIGNYIVAIGLKNSEEAMDIMSSIDTMKTEVVILNMSGEIVGTISNPQEKYIEISPSLAGFAVNRINIMCQETEGVSVSDNSREQIPCDIKSTTEAYNLPREVQTKVTGKGIITVVNTSVAGESVTYVVTPENGYVLGKVIITDEAGNIIETTENTFTMPTSSVTIEAIFEPANPETEDITIMSLAIILLFGSILTLVNYRRLRNIR